MGERGYQSAPQSLSRPLLEFICGKFHFHGAAARVVFRRNGKLSVGCSDVTIHALKELVRQYDDWMGKEEHVVQG
jgi:hypothetical protein